MEAPLLASLFELGGELGTTVDLHRPDRKGHAELQGVEELSGGLSCGAGVRLQHVPAGNHVAGGELFKDHARNGTDVQGVDFDLYSSSRWVTLFIPFVEVGNGGGTGGVLSSLTVPCPAANC